ncbi:MAG: transpeptidase family protein [Deltaproteobacteria bacterium]|nr:transpeptidase family protein [Deltaproteobacteria bacterium]
MKKRRNGSDRAGLTKEPRDRLKSRIRFVFAVFIFSFGMIFLRAFQLQVVRGEALEAKAKLQHERTVKVPSKRGGIFDRNLEELAVTLEVDSVFAHPSMVEDPYRVSHALAPMLSVNRREVERRFAGESKFVWIKRQVDLSGEQRDAIKGIEGIGTVKENRRFYPGHPLAANLIGFTGVDSNGLEGVELHYDRYLKGEPITVKAERDATGRLLLFEDIRGPVRGMDVVLTIDKAIQYMTEKALKKAVDKYGAKAGVAVVMDPHTGEILAMANFPTFDPNDPRGHREDEWRNRAVTDMFEPGSTLKVFLLAAAIEEGIASPNDTFYCENGVYRVKGATFHDHDGKKYGWLSAGDIIKYSSNIGAAKIGERLGKRGLYRYLKSFGFGDLTGVDLPGEAQGMLAHPRKWSGVSVDTIAFGQGMSATSLQLVSAISAIANGGFLMQPHVVKGIRNPSGQPAGSMAEEFYPAIERRVVSEDTARSVTKVLTEVTKPGGTGEKAALGNGFEVAGKTGTAQKPDHQNGGYTADKYVSSFLGFVPAQNPKFAIMVALDEPRKEYYGGSVAAPVFREIAAEGLAYLGVFPRGALPENPPDVKTGIRTIEANRRHSVLDGGGDDGETNEVVSTAGTPSLTAIQPAVPDFTGKTVRTVMRIAKERALDVDVEGSGRAVEQTPLPGGAVPKDGGIRVVFE